MMIDRWEMMMMVDRDDNGMMVVIVMMIDGDGDYGEDRDDGDD